LQASLWLKDPRQRKATQSGNLPTMHDVAQHLLFNMLRTLELDDDKTAEAIENKPEAVRTRHQQLPPAKRPKTDDSDVEEPIERQGLDKLRWMATRDANARAVPIDPANQATTTAHHVSRAVHGERVGLRGWVQYHAAGSQAVAVKVLLDTIVALGVQSLLYTALAGKVDAALSEHAETCVYMVSRSSLSR